MVLSRASWAAAAVGTNADGDYVLCGYWDDSLQVVRVQKDGYGTAIPGGADWHTDIELTPR